MTTTGMPSTRSANGSATPRASSPSSITKARTEPRPPAWSYRWDVPTRPVHLVEAVHRARVGLETSGELPRPGGYRSPLGPEDRAVVARLIADGTYRRLADAVAATDHEVADL